MTNRSQQSQRLTDAADAALRAATDALGTQSFPLLLVEYQRAMERANTHRLMLRLEEAQGERETSGGSGHAEPAG